MHQDLSPPSRKFSNSVWESYMAVRWQVAMSGLRVSWDFSAMALTLGMVGLALLLHWSLEMGPELLEMRPELLPVVLVVLWL